MSAGKRGATVTYHDGEGRELGRCTLLDLGPKSGDWWATPVGARTALVVRWHARMQRCVEAHR